MSKTHHLHLFEGFGIEAEYMIVDHNSLQVRPIADEILRDASGMIVNELEFEHTAWSNELALHVIEMKSNGPARSLRDLGEQFHRDVVAINDLLSRHGAMLLGTAMHPTMVPDREMKLWPHDDSVIYDTYHRIFNCRGHGWSNLQSVHINFPFYDDREFGVLHAAIRAVLPLIPALAAASPVFEGGLSGDLDSRLRFYLGNQKKVPEITGHVIPEPAFSESEYDALVYDQIRRAIAPYDPDKVLDQVWLNSRGAIARFDRNAIEIRVIDIQESPRADMSVVALVIGAVKALAEERYASAAVLRGLSETRLKESFLRCVQAADRAVIEDRDLLQVFGIDRPSAEGGAIWTRVFEDLVRAKGFPVRDFRESTERMLGRGSLARAIASELKRGRSIDEVYRDLAGCLRDNRFFGA